LKSQEILSRLVRRFGLLALVTLLGAIAGAVYGAVKTPTYTAKAYVVAIGNEGDSNTALNFAQAYGRIAISGPVLALAGTRLGSNTNGLTRVTASTSPDAPVIQVTANGTSAQHAADLANAVADGLVNYGNTRRTDTHVGLAMLAGATKPTKPSSPKPPLELVVGAAAGLLIGALALLAGIGRPSTGDEEAAKEDEPAEYQVADATEPVGTERYLGVARTVYPPKVITYWAAPPSELPTPEDRGRRYGEPVNGSTAEKLNGSVPEQRNGSMPEKRSGSVSEKRNGSRPEKRIVGRAVVSEREDR